MAKKNGTFGILAAIGAVTVAAAATAAVYYKREEISEFFDDLADRFRSADEDWIEEEETEEPEEENGLVIDVTVECDASEEETESED